MGKSFLGVIVFPFIYISGSAVVSNPIPRVVLQPDSTHLSIILYGDEYGHVLSTIDCIPLVETLNGIYYAEWNGNDIISSQYLAHDEKDRTSEEKTIVANRSEVVWAELHAIRSRNMNYTNRERFTRSANNANLGINSSYLGEKKGLVVLVNFSNKRMLESSAPELKKMFNEIGYNGNGHIGSVHDYFYDMSYGRFSLSFDVVGPVELSNTYGYYGSNRNVSGNDKYPGRMVVDACNLIVDQVNFSDYDWDGDGKVDQVFLVYAGYGEATGGASTTIWPHESSLTNCSLIDNTVGPLSLDSVIIDTYACANELDGNIGNSLMGIGVACHEFSHCLGLPDLYDVSYDGGFGMNVWDVMDAGSHSGPKGKGEVPYGYSAYERWLAGWLDFKEILATQKVSNINCLSEKPEAYIIRNDGWNNEFYILENHQDKGWYQYTGTTMKHHGLMITHVDFDQDAWAKNRVNAERNHQRLSIIPADNDFGEFYSFNSKSGFSPNDKDLAGDLFPGIRNITELTNTSHENVGGRWFNPNIDGSFFLDKSIINIVENDGAISFDVIYLNSDDGIEQINKNNENDIIIYDIRGQKITHPRVSGMYIFKKNGLYFKKIIIN